MAEFLKTDMNRAGFFTIMEDDGNFGFGGAEDNFTENLAEDVAGAVGRWKTIIRLWQFGGVLGPTAEEMVASSAGTSLGCS